jgi:hypothetical protein
MRRNHVTITESEFVYILAMASVYPMDKLDEDKVSPELKSVYYKVNSLMDNPPDTVRIVG